MVTKITSQKDHEYEHKGLSMFSRVFKKTTRKTFSLKKEHLKPHCVSITIDTHTKSFIYKPYLFGFFKIFRVKKRHTSIMITSIYIDGKVMQKTKDLWFNHYDEVIIAMRELSDIFYIVNDHFVELSTSESFYKEYVKLKQPQ